MSELIEILDGYVGVSEVLDEIEANASGLVSKLEADDLVKVGRSNILALHDQLMTSEGTVSISDLLAVIDRFASNVEDLYDIFAAKQSTWPLSKLPPSLRRQASVQDSDDDSA